MNHTELYARAADASAVAARLFAEGRNEEARKCLMKALYASDQMREKVRPAKVRERLLAMRDRL